MCSRYKLSQKLLKRIDEGVVISSGVVKSANFEVITFFPASYKFDIVFFPFNFCTFLKSKLLFIPFLRRSSHSTSVCYRLGVSYKTITKYVNLGILSSTQARGYCN